MNELEPIKTGQLPDTLEDLATWDRFLSARLPTYRKLLHNVKSWEEATEEEKRILRRAQEESENLIDVRVRIGELYQNIPKDKGGRPEKTPDINVGSSTDKQTFKESTGLSDKQAERYQKLASHPEAVAKAKAEARERNDVVSQQDVLKRIITPPKSKEAERRQELKEAKRRKDNLEASKIVNISDAKQDKEDTELLGYDLYKKLLKLTDDADKITFVSKDRQLSSLVKVMKPEMLAVLSNGIQRTIEMLTEILEVIG